MASKANEHSPSPRSDGEQSTSNVDNAGAQRSDTEKQTLPSDPEKKSSAFKSLGWLDRFLAVWILLAMIIGILLGNFVPETGPALQKGKFVGVSIPIGESRLALSPQSMH